MCETLLVRWKKLFFFQVLFGCRAVTSETGLEWWFKPNTFNQGGLRWREGLIERRRVGTLFLAIHQIVAEISLKSTSRNSRSVEYKEF